MRLVAFEQADGPHIGVVTERALLICRALTLLHHAILAR
jgi:hypothetical protein